eukprot:sb/3475366/
MLKSGQINRILFNAADLFNELKALDASIKVRFKRLDLRFLEIVESQVKSFETHFNNNLVDKLKLFAARLKLHRYCYLIRALLFLLRYNFQPLCGLHLIYSCRGCAPGPYLWMFQTFINYNVKLFIEA